MSTKNPPATPAPPTTELVTVRNGQQLPAYIKAGDTRGTEAITDKDVRFPALKLAQGTTPQVKRASAKFIPDLREGDFFNTATKEIYGEGPLKLVVVRYVGNRHNVYDPKDRTVVLESNLPDTDPRTQWGPRGTDGKRAKPIARKFEDFLVVVFQEDKDGKLTHDAEVTTLTLSGTQLKKAVDLNTELRHAKLPAFAIKWSVVPVPESGNGNSWYGYQFVRDGYPPEAIYLGAEKAYELSKDKTIGGLDDEPDEPVNDEHIPF